MARPTVSQLFIAALEDAHTRNERAVAKLVHERFNGLPRTADQVLGDVTNDYPALTPNEDGEFLLAA